MPELPEVERGRRLAQTAAAGKRIQCAHIEPDPIVFAGLSVQTVRAALEGRRVDAVRRWGKQLWFELDRAPHPLWHFGMTGAFHVQGDHALQLKAGPKLDTTVWPPRFCKALLTLEDGIQLAFCDARRFGRFALRAQPEQEPPIANLGFDPLLAMPSTKAFRALVSPRTSVIKSLLLDQSFVAGVGNWIADEVLYQAGIDPRRRAKDLEPVEVKRLCARLGAIVRAAVNANADDNAYPKSWLFHRRWGRPVGSRMGSGERIEFITVGGRTTAWVPERQS